MDIYRDANRRVIYPPLFTDPEGDSCFSIYQVIWIKKRFFNFFFRNFRETTRHFSLRSQNSEYLTVILRGRAGYELIYISNEAVGRVGYYQLISGKSEKNNCFSKFSSNSLDFSGETSSNRDIFFTDDAAKQFFPTSKISAQEIRHQFFLIWSNLTIMAHMMGLGNQSESWKIIIMS